MLSHFIDESWIIKTSENYREVRASLIGSISRFVSFALFRFAYERKQTQRKLTSRFLITLSMQILNEIVFRSTLWLTYSKPFQSNEIKLPFMLTWTLLDCEFSTAFVGMKFISKHLHFNNTSWWTIFKPLFHTWRVSFNEILSNSSEVWSLHFSL